MASRCHCPTWDGLRLEKGAWILHTRWVPHLREARSFWFCEVDGRKLLEAELPWEADALPEWIPSLKPDIGLSRGLVCALVAHSCPTLCNSMDCSPPGSSVRGISQARILEWVAMSSSRGSSRPRDPSRSPALQTDSELSEPCRGQEVISKSVLPLLCIIILGKTLHFSEPLFSIPENGAINANFSGLL